MTNEHAKEAECVYKLHDDVFLSYDKETECSRILKLNDDDYFYEANLVAGEIVKKINGVDSYRQIVDDVASAYAPEHAQAILTGANKLLDDLLREKLIRKVESK